MKALLLPALATLIATSLSGATPLAADAKSGIAAPTIGVVIRAGDAGSKFLAAEYARTIIHVLGGHERLVVLPRARVLKAEVSDETAPEIGRTLPATHVLLATVHVTGEAFVFRGELIEVSSNRKLKTEMIRAALADGGGIAGRISREVRGALGLPSLADGERESRTTTKSSEAWQAYLKGRRALETLTDSSLLEAIHHFETAVSTDPKFGIARVASATAHIALGYNFRNPRVHFSQARDHLNHSIPEQSALPEAITADVVLKFYHERDWQGAARGAHLVTGNDPSALETHACLLHCAQSLGRHEDAQNETASAHRAQPGSMAIRAELSCGAYYAGKFGEAEREARAALKVDPDNPLLYWSLARALTQQGNFDPALAALTTAQTKSGGDWTGILAEKAYVYGRQDRRADAQRIIADLRKREKNEYVDAYLYAMAYAGVGETADVCRHLAVAATNHSTWIPSVAIDPKFAQLRNEPQFRAIVRTLGLSVD